MPTVVVSALELVLLPPKCVHGHVYWQSSALVRVRVTAKSEPVLFLLNMCTLTGNRILYLSGEQHWNKRGCSRSLVPGKLAREP